VFLKPGLSKGIGGGKKKPLLEAATASQQRHFRAGNDGLGKIWCLLPRF